jgi:hypothetical protein
VPDIVQTAHVHKKEMIIEVSNNIISNINFYNLMAFSCETLAFTSLKLGSCGSSFEKQRSYFFLND